MIFSVVTMNNVKIPPVYILPIGSGLWSNWQTLDMQIGKKYAFRYGKQRGLKLKTVSIQCVVDENHQTFMAAMYNI